MAQRCGVQWLAAAALAAAVSATAQPAAWPSPGERPGDPGRSGPGMPPPGRSGAIARDLGLSESQQEKVRAIEDARREEREALFEKITANRDALNRLLESGGADANAVGELVLEGRRLHEQSQALREAERNAIRGVLTPDQQKRFDAMREKRRERGPGPGPDRFPGRPQGGPGGPGDAGVGSGVPRPPQGQSRSGQQPFQF